MPNFLRKAIGPRHSVHRLVTLTLIALLMCPVASVISIEFFACASAHHQLTAIEPLLSIGFKGWLIGFLPFNLLIALLTWYFEVAPQQ